MTMATTINISLQIKSIDNIYLAFRRLKSGFGGVCEQATDRLFSLQFNPPLHTSPHQVASSSHVSQVFNVDINQPDGVQEVKAEGGD